MIAFRLIAKKVNRTIQAAFSGMLGGLLSGMTLTVCLAVSAVSADDTEVFFSQLATDTTNSANAPNILFVLDDSLSMYAFDNGQVGTRMERMQEAMHDMFSKMTNVNVGLMTMNGDEGGGPVRYPVTPIDKPVCVEADDCLGTLLYSTVIDPDDDSEQSLVNGKMLPNGKNLSVRGYGRTSNPQLVGVRFTDIGIPQGATIISAVLEMTAQTTDSGAGTFTVWADKSETAREFTEHDWDFTNRPQTSTVTYDPGAWTEGEQYESADLSPVIQQVVDQNNWCGGNDIALILGGTDNRSIVSYESSLNHVAAERDYPAMSLRVVYDQSTIPDGKGCTLDTQIAQVTGKNNDAYQLRSSNRMLRRTQSIRLPQSNDTNSAIEHLSGFRFAQVTVPQGAEITDARVEFTVAKGSSGDFSARILGQATNSAASIRKGSNDLSNRAKTVATVDWIHTEDTTTGDKLESPDISPIVQEIVNRGGWKPLNELMIFVERKDTGGSYQEVKTFDESPGVAAKIYITYKTHVGDSDFSSLSERTARHELSDIIDQLRGNYFTPILSLQYEAAQYMLGGDVTYGRKRGGNFINSNFLVSHPDSYTGGSLITPSGCTQYNPFAIECEDEEIVAGPDGSAPTYTSPIEDSCQTNHIVLLSDGAATRDNADDLIRPLIGAASCDENSSTKQACGTDLMRWLNENDHNSTIPGKQNVITHTVAFNLSGSGATYLQNVAAAGGGEYHTAASAADLTSAFSAIIDGAQAVDTSFTAPGTTVNQFNRLSHREDVYFALFQPNETPRWTGNIKRYKLGVNATQNVDDAEAEILDANDTLAVDIDTGFFKDSARSFWDHFGDNGTITSEADGADVSKGGTASRIGAKGIDSRKLYTYLGDASAIPADGIDLNSGDHKLHEDNTGITADMLALGTTGTEAERQAKRTELLKWVRGVDIKDENEDGFTNDSRRHMGDPMHAQPVIVNYRTDTTTNDRSVVYVSTNEGILHAFDASNGDELWAFSPKELMGNHNIFFEDLKANSHPYGLDGPLSIWREETNENFVIENGESAYLYASMRRGGSNYYAFDITNPTDPKLKWVINGSDEDSAEFKELGQSWSRAKHASLMDNDVARDVLIFGAGYDENQDGDPQRDQHGNAVTMNHDTDSIGRGIFIVDARTGERIWSIAGPDLGNNAPADQRFENMKYSIPGDIRIVDIDYDGYIDQLYASDTGGQVWRFDVIGSTSDTLLQGGVVADLSTTDNAGHRRFYGEPDVALIQQEGLSYLAVSIGSGWRAHPLNDIVKDAQYVLRIPDIRNKPEGYGVETSPGNYRPITESDLKQVNAGGSGNADLTHGWFLRFPDAGEKVIGTSLIFKNVVYFSSYVPAPDTDNCSTALGSGYAYALSVIDGSPVADLDNDGVIETYKPGEPYKEDDMRFQLTHQGPPPNATILVSQGLAPEVFIGTEKVPSDITSGTTRTYWVDTGAVEE